MNTTTSNGWQDIATAPQQTRVIVGNCSLPGWQRFAINVPSVGWLMCLRSAVGASEPVDHEPTHWHPEPAPLRPPGSRQ